MLKSNITFNNTFIENLPGDNESSNFRRQVEHAAYSMAMPLKVSDPLIIATSENVADIIGFDAQFLHSNEFTQVFSGNEILFGMQPYAMCYGGHQFGHWAGQLGDGRAINLGEVITDDHGHQTLQLKGAGPTPYSRTADGLAVLRSSIREFLCSEAMFHLGIPTTRALSLCLTGEYVTRDMFYDGNAKAELGAVVCRVSPSFMRFGSIQLPAMRGDIDLVRSLVNHSIKQDFSYLLSNETNLNEDHYLAWFNEICDRTCTMIVHWMRVGFVHGVMNTDNMSIIGETIDYGPYGWIDDFNLDWTPNTTDTQHKRYRFGNQAEISLWNLYQLANAIIPLVSDTSPLQARLDSYAEQYEKQWQAMMNKKLGLLSMQEDDIQLYGDLEILLGSVETDMTIFYRSLAKLPLEQFESSKQSHQFLNNSTKNKEELIKHFKYCYYHEEQLTSQYFNSFLVWLNQYADRVSKENYSDNNRQNIMNAVNPKYVLRNYLAQQAIENAEKGDYRELHLLQKILKNPYDEQPKFESYAQKRPKWAKTKAGCSMLSCSS